ncbi:hypothetical protein [Amnibacterium kyonggiense]|uniref:hypothetical protein n=1 Tax=Amnibacterium kyonggiense TaxID=595671 RepID=UPI0013C2E175|nr:hypothetical protein [Amnibacterium kyonggiense]
MSRHRDWSELDARARAVLAQSGGVAHISAFDAAGITRKQVGLLHGRGVIERPRIGWFVDPDSPWQVKRAVGVGGAAACVSSADAMGLPTPPSTKRSIHVAVEAHASHLRHSRDRRWVLDSVHDDERLELHWGGLVDAPVGGRTSIVDTLLLLSGCVPFDWFVAALDAAMRALGTAHRCSMSTIAVVSRPSCLVGSVTRSTRPTPPRRAPSSRCFGSRCSVAGSGRFGCRCR